MNSLHDFFLSIVEKILFCAEEKLTPGLFEKCEESFGIIFITGGKKKRLVKVAMKF